VTLLSVERLRKSYGGAVALRDASLTVAPGELVALMGENGAGKSTLIRILAGATAPDGGAIALDGAPVAIRSPAEAHRLGLRFIHQELAQIPAMSVAENLFLGRAYPARRGGLVDWPELARRARAALDALGLGHVRAGATLGRLPVGDRLLVKIAAALLDDAPARLFVMDEPTAALTGAESERLFGIVARLRARGCGVLYVSHRIDEVLRLADRITVLRDGRTEATIPRAAATRADLIAAMTGRAEAETAAAAPAPAGARVALTVDSLADGVLRDVSFELREGEILGVAGLADSGQDRLLAALMGAATAGAVTIGEARRRARSPAEAWRQGFAHVPRERRAQGLFLRQDVTRNVTLPHLSRLGRFGVFLDRRAERLRAGETARRVRLKAAGLHQRLWRLSGGNQQKVMLARAVAGAPRVLLLDEPTRGVDIGAKFDIYALLRELAAAGAAMIVASSDLDELVALSERIAVLRAGRIVGIVPAAGLTPARLLALCYGDPAP
jgi:ABC-type sugar transport system ATPase subunit